MEEAKKKHITQQEEPEALDGQNKKKILYKSKKKEMEIVWWPYVEMVVEKKNKERAVFVFVIFPLSLSPSFLFFLLHETSNTPRKNFQVALGRPASFQDLRTGASAIFVTDHLMLWNLKENVVSSSSSSEIDICRRRCDTSCFFPSNFIL